eukprot:gb/GECG01002182.1/.p1 GENE.gb/GECG01002182.1/~~gb/GECG01002182.1/.p1  ORF type:complete len:178 (+),score=6.39 gb/GECG01002182.1/:1-534(+)
MHMSSSSFAHGVIRSGNESLGTYARLGRIMPTFGKSEAILYPPFFAESDMHNPLATDPNAIDFVPYYSMDIAWSGLFSALHGRRISHSRKLPVMRWHNADLNHIDIQAGDLEKALRFPTASTLVDSITSLRVYNFSLAVHDIDFHRLENLYNVELIGPSRAPYGGWNFTIVVRIRQL